LNDEAYCTHDLVTLEQSSKTDVLQNEACKIFALIVIHNTKPPTIKCHCVVVISNTLTPQNISLNVGKSWRHLE